MSEETGISDDLAREIDDQRFVDLARARRQRAPQRFAMYLGAFLIGLIWVSAPWSLICLGLVMLAELNERRATRTILDHPDQPVSPARRRDMMAANLATAAATGGAITAAWILAEPSSPVFALCFLFAAALDSAMSNQQVYPLTMARQIFYVSLGVALAVLNGYLHVGFDGAFLSTHVAPIVAFGGFAIAISHASARNYSDRLRVSKELERARDEAVAAREAREAFFAAISHEMRTPLHGILGMARHLREEAGLLPDYRDKVRIISETSETLNVLLSDLLDMARIKSGKLEIRPRNASLYAALRHVVDLFRPLADEKGLTLSLDIAPDTPDWLEFDGARVRQCVGNLVSNALKFTEQGRVEVRAWRIDRPSPEGEADIAIEVADSGPGIESHARPRIFEPFEHAGDRAAAAGAGAGLGLAIARNLAQKMNGDLICRSVPGLGSRFTFTFRARLGRPEAPKAANGATTSHAPAQEGASVIVVDDVATNRAIARLFLAPLDVETLEAGSGDELEAILRDRDASLVLLDLWMPGRNGEEIMRQIRGGAFGRADMPIMALTADQTADRERLIEAGFDDVLLKPLDREELLASVLDALSRNGSGAPAA